MGNEKSIISPGLFLRVSSNATATTTSGSAKGCQHIYESVRERLANDVDRGSAIFFIFRRYKLETNLRILIFVDFSDSKYPWTAGWPREVVVSATFLGFWVAMFKCLQNCQFLDLRGQRALILLQFYSFPRIYG